MRTPSRGFTLALAGIFVAALAFGWWQGDKRVEEGQAIEQLEAGLREWHERNAQLAPWYAAQQAFRDSLTREKAAAVARADRERTRRAAAEARLTAALPDTGEAREAFEEFAGACRAEAEDLRLALGYCEQARLSYESEADSLRSERDGAIALADTAGAQWRRFFDLRRSAFVTCGPGLYLSWSDAGLGVSCHVPLVQLRLPRLWPF